jgi:spore coat polysaccharide biosynthesis protein SpsF
MMTGIVITARLGSTRLKRKHLHEANGMPMLAYLIGRVSREFKQEIQAQQAQIIIATSDESENRDFERFTSGGVKVFYGSINNIPLRHLEAAQANALDLIVAVDGDDILCSMESMRRVFETLTSGKPYVKSSGLPLGMNAFGYSRNFLQQSLECHYQETLETGWGRIFDPSVLVDIPLTPTDNGLPLRFTLDYPEDLSFFRAVISELGPNVLAASDSVIISTVVDKRLYELNEQIAREYWVNFHNDMNKEVNNNELE